MLVIIAVYSVILTFFIIFDLFPLLKEKQWKEFWIYTTLISAAFAIFLLIGMDYKLPSPAVPIKNLVQYIFGIKSE